jgi:hypothetical protein
MIQIDDVGDGSYAFPTIDFKFHNPGGTSAVLWQFAIEVLEAKLDLTPVLAFTFGVGFKRSTRGPLVRGGYPAGGELVISMVNHGWGQASDCEAILDEPTLNQFFSEDQRRFIGGIESQEKKQILRLSLNRDNEQFPRIPIHELSLKWRCKDANGQMLEGQDLAQGRGDLGELYLSPSGFEYHRMHAVYEKLFSDVTYCTIIDPLLGAHERAYPISRVIPPGEAERFHILVGATRSAALRLRFRFSIGKDAVVTSDEFTIHIWNPSGSGWDSDYIDGQQVERRERELKAKAELNKDERRELLLLGRRAKRLGQQSNHPFLDSAHPLARDRPGRRRSQ